jgi:hypothetical protein
MAPNAFADEIKTFDLVTTISTPPSDAPPGPLDASGTVTVDTTTGVIDAIDLSFAPAAASTFTPFTQSGATGPAPDNFVYINESWSSGDGYYDVSIVLPVDTLAGYAGGLICSTENPCPNGETSGFSFGDSEEYAYTSGSLELSPEPSSLILMFTGALGMCVVLRRKKARSDHLPGPISI